MKNKYLLLIILNLILILPSIRFFDKFLNLYFFGFYILFFNFIFIVSINKKEIVKKILSFPYWGFILIILSIANYFIYPLVDARKKIANSGSTGDDAMILAANTLKSTAKLYDVIINNHTPISPGPGWIILNSPFPLLNLFFLFSPIYLFFILFLIKKYYKNIISNLFIIILFMSLITVELFFNGHDILPFSLCFLICTLLIHENLKKDINIKYVILISIFLGMVSTSRIIFFFVPFLFYFLLNPYHKKNSIILLIISSIIFWGFNTYFYFINKIYQPLHLIHKAKNLLGIPILIFGSCIFITINYFIIKKIIKDNIENWLLIIMSVFSLILIPVSLGDLIRQDFNFKTWEGANYFMPIIPFFVLYINLKNYTINENNCE